MQTEDLVRQAQEAITVRRVFGEPYQSDGLTIIPAASVRGGGGGGGGTDGSAEAGVGQGAQGSGAGFGMTARPAGAYVIQGGEVRWRPAIDVNRIIAGGQVVAIVALLTLRAVAKARARRQPRRRGH